VTRRRHSAVAFGFVLHCVFWVAMALIERRHRRPGTRRVAPVDVDGCGVRHVRKRGLARFAHMEARIPSFRHHRPVPKLAFCWS
jgi:hypothetical protein